VTNPRPKKKAADERPEQATPREEPERAAEEAAAEEAAAADARSNGAEAAEADAPAQEDPVTKLEAERDEYLQMAQRAQADFENYRKRAAKDMAAAGERAKIGLVRDLLPVVDNLERALASADGDSALADGVRLVPNDLQGVFAREGVHALEPVGEQFDPTVHDALSTRQQDGAEAGVVLDVVEKGYRLGDTVIRPARVVVSA